MPIPALFDHPLDLISHRLGVLVLPEAQWHPADLSEVSISVEVASAVRGELLLPPGCVRLRCNPVLGAAMPEAPIDEHRHPCWSEEDVSTSSGHLRKRGVHPVAKSSAMQDPPEGELRLGVATAGVRHPR